MIQDELEELVLNVLRAKWSGFPKGKVIKSESPDFIVQSGKKAKTGIEITEIAPLEASRSKNHGILRFESAFEQIKASIENKEMKYNFYQTKKLNQIILLIHFDYFDGPKSFNLDNHLGNWQFENSFAKVFLLDLFESSLYQIE